MVPKGIVGLWLGVVALSFVISLGETACVNNLTLPDPSSGMIQYQSTTGTSTTGQQANITCNSGYVIVGTNISSQALLCIGGLNPWTPPNVTNCVLNVSSSSSSSTTTTAAIAGAAAVSATTTTPPLPTYCKSGFCANGGSCKDTQPNGLPTAVCTCMSGFVGPTCNARAQDTVDLDYLRSLSQDAYYTQRYSVNWSKQSVTGDQLKIAMSCTIAITGALLTAGSYYLSKCLFPKPASDMAPF